METHRYLILGGGMVAGYAAKELVRLGLEPGRLAIISADSALPYERPPLSKAFLAGRKDEAGVSINDAGFYRDHGISVLLDSPVETLDLGARRLTIRGGGEHGFDQLVIATGAAVRRFELPGAGLDGVLYLRSLEDAKRIRAQMQNARSAVVIGSGFIGMEVASVLAQKGIRTTLVFPDERVWQRFFTPEMSAAFQRYYAARGVTLLPRARVSAFTGDRHVAGVVLASGQTLPAELVVAGIGVTPATEALTGAGLRLQDGVLVNEYLETNLPDVYAAGDVARYRDVIFEKDRRVEHWDNAVEQGRHVARALLGERTPFVHVPYFFSDVFDLSYEFWGDTADADQAVLRGDPDQSSFSVWWLKQGRLVAAFVLNRPDEERQLAPEWIKARSQVPAEILGDPGAPLTGTDGRAAQGDP